MVLEMSNKRRSTSMQTTLKYAECRSGKTVFQFISIPSQETRRFFWATRELESYLFIVNCAISSYTYLSTLTKLQVLMFQLPQESYSIISLFGQDINSQRSMVRNINFKTRLNRTNHKVRKNKVKVNNKRLLNKNNSKKKLPKI